MGVTHKPKGGSLLTGADYTALDSHEVAVSVAEITATGTPGVSNFLRGDGAWASVPAGATGATGPAGATGSAGARGATGTTGAAGAVAWGSKW